MAILHDKKLLKCRFFYIDLLFSDYVNGMRGVKKGGMGSVGTSEDGEESSSVQDEDEEAILIENFLSNIKAPQVNLRVYLLIVKYILNYHLSIKNANN